MAQVSDLQNYLDLLQQGFNPDQIMRMQEEKRISQMAQATPAQLANMFTARGASALRSGLFGLVGGPEQDPALRMASQMRELQKQFDTTTAQGMGQYAQALRAINPMMAEKAALLARDMGIKEAQLFREQATGMKAVEETRRVSAQAAREETANQREDQLRGELSALPPTATDAEVEAVVRKYGKPDQIFSILERRQKAEADRQAKTELEREKAEERRRRDEENRAFQREMAAVRAEQAAALTADRREMANLRMQELLDKRKDREDKQEAAKAAAITHANKVINDVKETTQLVGGLTTGIVGKASSFVPGTDAYNLNQRLLTLKANLGFDRLQQMREASPTGGALGQVAVQELNALQATVGSLDIGQDKKELAKNLEKVEHHYNNWLRTTQNLPALSLEEFRKTKATVSDSLKQQLDAAVSRGELTQAQATSIMNDARQQGVQNPYWSFRPEGKQSPATSGGWSIRPKQ